MKITVEIPDEELKEMVMKNISDRIAQNIQNETLKKYGEDGGGARMSDLISRQAAIDAVSDCGICIQRLVDLPSAQPEQKKGEWISVTERLPDVGVFVLVCNDDGHMMIAKYEEETYEWYYKYTNYDFDIWDNEEQGPVMWWMPLPEPPTIIEAEVEDGNLD